MSDKLLLVVNLLLLIAVMIFTKAKIYAPDSTARFFSRHPILEILLELYAIAVSVSVIAFASIWQGWAHPVLYNYFWFGVFIWLSAIGLHIGFNLKNYIPAPQVVIPPAKIKMSFSDNSEYIYLAQRTDGIYKVGMTTDPTGRMKALGKDYDIDFIPVAFWRVDDMRQAERAALDLTRPYHYVEGRRKELREMTSRQAYRFTSDFTRLLEQEYGMA